MCYWLSDRKGTLCGQGAFCLSSANLKHWPAPMTWPVYSVSSRLISWLSMHARAIYTNLSVKKILTEVACLGRINGGQWFFGSGILASNIMYLNTYIRRFVWSAFVIAILDSWQNFMSMESENFIPFYRPQRHKINHNSYTLQCRPPIFSYFLWRFTPPPIGKTCHMHPNKFGSRSWHWL